MLERQFFYKGYLLLTFGRKQKNLTLDTREKKKKGLLLQLLDNVEDSVMGIEGADMAGLLGEFEDIFEDPTGLPPSRSHDHAIILKTNAKQMCVRLIIISIFKRQR